MKQLRMTTGVLRSKHSKASKERYLLGHDWQNQQSLVVFRLAAVKMLFRLL